MKIYTKTGDSGQTSLFGGQRVPKHHIRIESYGTLDELNSHLGLIVVQNIEAKHKKNLIEIQKKLFVIGALLATPPEDETLKNGKNRLSVSISLDDILFLEHTIDEMEKDLLPMTHFILPGGNTTVSYCHIARCVCRRAERLIVFLNETEKIDKKIIQYINRLSDFLFVLARKISAEQQAEEIRWMP